MGATDVADIDDVIFEKTEKGFAIKAATFPYLVRRSLNDFGEYQRKIFPQRQTVWAYQQQNRSGRLFC